jgi:hypothetical protein
MKKLLLSLVFVTITPQIVNCMSKVLHNWVNLKVSVPKDPRSYKYNSKIEQDRLKATSEMLDAYYITETHKKEDILKFINSAREDLNPNDFDLVFDCEKTTPIARTEVLKIPYAHATLVPRTFPTDAAASTDAASKPLE